MSLLEGIPSSGASCTVEKFIHAKKILLVSVQTETCYRDTKMQFRLLHLLLAAISLPEVSWTFLLVVLFVAVLHGDALHPSFPD